jgi:hypothetical protein
MPQKTQCAYFHQSFIRTGADVFVFGATGAGAGCSGSLFDPTGAGCLLFEASGAGASSDGRGLGKGRDDGVR